MTEIVKSWQGWNGGRKWPPSLGCSVMCHYANPLAAVATDNEITILLSVFTDSKFANSLISVHAHRAAELLLAAQSILIQDSIVSR